MTVSVKFFINIYFLFPTSFVAVCGGEVREEVVKDVQFRQTIWLCRNSYVTIVLWIFFHSPTHSESMKIKSWRKECLTKSLESLKINTIDDVNNKFYFLLWFSFFFAAVGKLIFSSFSSRYFFGKGQFSAMTSWFFTSTSCPYIY